MPRIRALGVAALLAIAATACGGDDGDDSTSTTDPVEETTTTLAPDVAAAQEAFCAAGAEYVAVLDGYGRLFSDPTVTVGQLRTDASGLAEGQEAVRAAAEALEAEFARAEEAAAGAEGEAAGEAAGDEPVETTTTIPRIEVDRITIDRVREAQTTLDEAIEGIDDDTPLAQATIEVSSAAYALQVSWLLLLGQADCIEASDEDLALVVEWTRALQADLATAGYYEGVADGIYGPLTVEAVKALQEEAGLPVTGVMDRASQSALAELLADRASTNTAALQGLLAGLGYWTGPIDGVWSEELSAAVSQLQADLGIPETGAMDLATLRAVRATLGAGLNGSTSSTVPPAPPTTAAPDPGRGTVAAALAADGRFTTLLQAVEAAGLAPVLAGTGPLTVFAPTDEAFAALPAGTLDALLADSAALRALLLGHVVDGAALRSDYLVLTGSATSAGATRLDVVAAGDPGTVTVAGAPVVTADIPAASGLVHAIGAVIQNAPGA
ncbi:MAG: peptidoglycan-binding protein [Acidimicrobiales bacterium]|nr:peptidoglycan-binding protein [Acidimicrobiales bacterium]